MKVISNAKKLVLGVPATNIIVNFPDGVVISAYGQDNQNPSVVVFNSTDESGTWQGANSIDGVIIINEVNSSQAKAIIEKLDGTVNGLNNAIDTAVKLGLTDQYTSDFDFVRKKLISDVSVAGLYRRNNEIVCNIYKDSDGVIWREMDGQTHHIEKDILLRTYETEAGNPINLEDIPVKECAL